MKGYIMPTRWRILHVVIAVLPILAFGASAQSRPTANANDDLTRATVTQLIDELTQIDSQSPGIDSAAFYDGFLADDGPGSFGMGVLGVAPPTVPPAMRELVRRGPVALPELVKHIDDPRPTNLRVGNIDAKGTRRQVGVNLFMFTFFSEEYDPRLNENASVAPGAKGWPAGEKDFKGSYNVKVGDICFVLIGQIVNRRLLAVRYQPSGGLIVNSPVESLKLAQWVKDDWSKADPTAIRSSLLADIHGAHRFPKEDKSTYLRLTVFPALERLKFYFPDAYDSLSGGDRKQKEAFEKDRLAAKS